MTSAAFIAGAICGSVITFVATITTELVIYIISKGVTGRHGDQKVAEEEKEGT